MRSSRGQGAPGAQGAERGRGSEGPESGGVAGPRGTSLRRAPAQSRAISIARVAGGRPPRAQPLKAPLPAPPASTPLGLRTPRRTTVASTRSPAAPRAIGGRRSACRRLGQSGTPPRWQRGLGCGKAGVAPGFGRPWGGMHAGPPGPRQPLPLGRGPALRADPPSGPTRQAVSRPGQGEEDVKDPRDFTIL